MLSSCSLDKLPETTLTDKNFWKSESDLRGACNRLYIDLPGFLTGKGHDLRSDELVYNNPDEISSGNRSVPEKDKEWTGTYNNIGVCNNIIVKGNTAPIREELRNRWIAEAYFFRAYNYFELVRKYGDVPLILKIFTDTRDPEILKGRTPREDVIQQCYKDLEFALEWLPEIDEVSTPEDWGRVSKSAVQGLLVRIGLFEGTFIKYHKLTNGNSEEHLDRAIKAAEQMIYRDRNHSLFPDFQKLFYFDGEGRKNQENIFIKVYGPNGKSNAIVYHNQSATKASHASITRRMVDNFLYTDGLPREKSPLYKVDIKHDDVFENRDPRAQMTIFAYREKAFKNAEYRSFDQVNHNGAAYPIKKGYMQEEFDSNSRETVDKMIIRYAEILISYAEALYERNGSITDEKLDDTVNAIRQRAGFTARLTNGFANANGLDILHEIRRERMVEFIDEQIHYEDIIRWKTAEDVLPQPVLGILFNEEESTKTAKELSYKFTDENGMYNGIKVYDQPNIYVVEEAANRSFDPERDYLYPIPSYEISTSKGNIKQNPKW